MISDVILAIAVLGVAAGFYILIASVIVLRFWVATDHENVLSVTRRRAGFLAPRRRSNQ